MKCACKDGFVKRLLLLAPALFLLACGGGADDPADAGPGSPDSANPAVATAQDASAQLADAEPAASAAEEPAPTGTGAAAEVTAPSDPSDGDWDRLIYWDAMIDWEQRLGVDPGPVPPELRSLLNELFASDLATADPYIVDLNLSGSSYATAVVLYLRERFNDPLAFSIRAFLELFPATTPEEEEPAYLRFKQRLFGTIHPTFAQFLDPAQPRTIAGREVVWGGVGVDGIPPLESPVFLTPDEAAGWINPSDQIVGVEINGDARAYPVRIIAWHELVNDTVGGVPVSLVYCTLCGSPILYDGRVDGAVYRFGTSGLLYRSNKLMYDRVTNTLWDQFVGEPVWGELVGSGIRVAPLPSVNTTWEQWLAAHPDTAVLDINTGFERDYGPGVAYRDYNASPRLMFPVPTGDSRLPAKEVVVVVRVEEELTAYPVRLLRERSLIHDEIGGQPIVVVATADGGGGRGYESAGLAFEVADLAAGLLTSADGRTWQLTETALVADDGQTLARLNGHNAFWFAIVNHSPNGRLYEDGGAAD